MAKRPDLLGDLARRQGTRPGAREQIFYEESERPAAKPPAPARRSPFMKKTYLLDPDLVRRIARRAHHDRVPISALVRFLLSEALSQVEQGRLQVPPMRDGRLTDPDSL